MPFLKIHTISFCKTFWKLLQSALRIDWKMVQGIKKWSKWPILDKCKTTCFLKIHDFFLQYYKVHWELVKKWSKIPKNGQNGQFEILDKCKAMPFLKIHTISFCKTFWKVLQSALKIGQKMVKKWSEWPILRVKQCVS